MNLKICRKIKKFCCTLRVLPSLFIEGGKGGDYFGKHEMENQQNRKHPTCRSCLVFAAGHLCICVSLLAVQHYRRCAEYGREPFGSTSDFLDWLCGNALYLDGFSGILYSTVCPQIGLSFCRRGEEVYRK